MSSIESFFSLLLPKPSESAIELPYLIVLALLFLIAILLLIFYCPSEWEKRLSRVTDDRLNNTGENYSSLKEYATTSPVDDFLRAVPGLLLIIGLSGTFLSLSVVLNDLKDLLHGNDDIQAQLQQTLSLLGSKFKISIWGILFNFIYRFFYAWSAGVLNNSIKKALQGIREQVSSADSSVLTRENQADRLTAEFRAALLKSSAQSNTLLENIDKRLGNFEQTVNELKKTVDVFGTVVTTTAKSLNDTTTEFVKSVKDFTGTIDRFERNNTHAVQEFTRSISGFDKNINQAFENFSKEVKATLEGISSTIRQSTKESGALITGTLEKLQPVIDTLNKQMTEMRQIISDVEALLEQLDHKMNASDTTNSRLADHIEDNQSAITAMNDNLETLVQVLMANLGPEGVLAAQFNEVTANNRSALAKIDEVIAELKLSNNQG